MRARFINEIKRNQEGTGLGVIGLGRVASFSIALEKLGLDKGNAMLYSDNSFDYNGDVDIQNRDLRSLVIDEYFRFGNVSGNFNCAHNYLKSLEGAPKKVGGWFACNHNYLQTLKGAPYVKNNTFWCQMNELSDLEGISHIVGCTIICGDNKLRSLKGAPNRVNQLSIDNNYLASLEYLPKTISGRLYCGDNVVEFTEEEIRKISNVRGTIQTH